MAETILGCDPTRADAAAQFALGQEALDTRDGFKGNVIRYVKAAGTIAINAAVRRDPANADEPNAVLATSATGQVIQGVALAALSSSVSNNNLFGWITIHGKATPLTAAVAAVDTVLVTTATAGTLDDLATNTDFTAVAIAAIGGVSVVSLDSTAATDGVLECFIQ